MARLDVYITNTAVFLPNQPVANDEIESILGMVGGRPSRAKRLILNRNGISHRYYVFDPKTGKPVYNNAQLTAEAVRNLFPNKIEMEDIDCLVTGTTTPDQIAPNHAVMVHGELKNPPCEAVSTSGICLSGVTALKYAYMAIKCGEHQSVVSTGSEVPSLLLHASIFEEEARHKVDVLREKPEIAFEKDFLRWLLSDGAGAFLLEPRPIVRSNQPVLKIEWIEVLSYANELEACMYIGAEKNSDGNLIGWNVHKPHELLERSIFSIKQDVKLLNDKVVPITFIRTLKRVIEKKGLEPDQIDYFLPHISSMYFYKKVQNALTDIDFNIPQEKWFTNLSSKGNTGAASIYIMLDELLKAGQVQSGEKLLCFIPESGRFSSSFMLLTAV